MNINGLACGIELYFGEDILTLDDELIPVRWTSYNPKERKYQGEISLKSQVQELFRDKLKKGNKSDFSDMDMILQEIFHAFDHAVIK